MKWNRKDKGNVAAVCQLRNGSAHPFGMLRSYTPLGSSEEMIYRQMRQLFRCWMRRWESWCA